MKIQSQDGFTLLEVMMGLVIFTLGLLLLSSMMVVALRGNVWSDKTTEVVQATREKIEEFRRLPDEDMASGADVRGNFSRTWEVVDVEAQLKQLTVVVSYSNEKAVVRACTTVTYLEVGE
ncbi:MAG: prepilin-type N-terminal cleavage/methylation domain-containing protein [Candidatus Zixiibacteriota bacterium]